VSIRAWRDYVRRKSEAGGGKGKEIDPRDFPVDAVREMVISPSQRSPLSAGRRTFIIRDVQRWSLAAANCFLKTLEEPPGGAAFVLITTNTQNVPETIQSRCQTLRLVPVRPERIASVLEGEGCEAEEAAWLSEFAGGSLARARKGRELELWAFSEELGRRLSGGGPDNLALSEWMVEQANEASSGRARRERLLVYLECVLYYYRKRVASSLGRPEQTGRWLAAGETVLEAIRFVESNASATLALDAMWTELTRMETGR
jgi:DNA polymerase-3 subunit delta'